MFNENEHSEVENAMPDTTGSECSGKGRGSHVGQKHFEQSEKESIFFLPGATIHLCKQTQISLLSVDY